MKIKHDFCHSGQEIMLEILWRIINSQKYSHKKEGHPRKQTGKQQPGSPFSNHITKHLILPVENNSVRRGHKLTGPTLLSCRWLTTVTHTKKKSLSLSLFAYLFLLGLGLQLSKETKWWSVRTDTGKKWRCFIITADCWVFSHCAYISKILLATGSLSSREETVLTL